MHRHRFAVFGIVIVAACGSLDPHASEHATPGAGGSGPGAQRPTGHAGDGSVSRPDMFVSTRTHLLALNPLAESLSIFNLQQLLVPGTSLLHSRMLPLVPRTLAGSSESELGLVLAPREGQLFLACTDPLATDLLPQPVDIGTDAGVLRTLTDGSTLFAVFGAGQNPYATPSGVSFGTVNGCVISLQPPFTSTMLGDGPYQVQLSSDGDRAYVASHSGVTRLDHPQSGPEATQLTADVISDLTLVSADGDYLIGRDAEGVIVLPGDGDPLQRLANAPGVVGAGGAGPTNLGGEPAIAADAGAPSAVPSAAPNVNMAPITANTAFAVAPSNKLVLATNGSTLARQDLPLLAPAVSVSVSATALALGSGDDCAVAYSPGQRLLTKVALDPLSTTTIALERRISSVDLMCRPSGESPCCNGLAIVVYESTPSPLGQSEAYSLVDLATGQHELRRSSAAVTGLVTFDNQNAVLLAFDDPTAHRHQFSLLTPFADADSRQLDGELGDRPTSVGTGDVAGSVAFIGLERRDGELLLVTRAPDKPVAPGSYNITHLRDFRLAERLKGLGQGGTIQ